MSWIGRLPGKRYLLTLLRPIIKGDEAPWPDCYCRQGESFTVVFQSDDEPQARRGATALYPRAIIQSCEELK